MVPYQLLNLILYYFSQVKINGFAVFHCWELETLNRFSKMATEAYFYTQYLTLAGNDSDLDYMQPLRSHNRAVLGIFLDLNCENSVLVLNKFNGEYGFGYHYHSLIYDEQQNVNNFRVMFSAFDLAVDAAVTYAMPKNVLSEPYSFMGLNSSNFSETYILSDVYNNGRRLGGSLNITLDREIDCDQMKCELGSYLSSLYQRTPYEHRSKMPDINFRVAVVQTKYPLNTTRSKMFDFLNTRDNIELNPIERFGFQVTSVVLDSLGCKLDYHLYSGWSVGDDYGGLIGSIITQAADIATSALAITEPRMKHCSVGGATGLFRQVCLFRTPRNSDIKADLFLKPFDTYVWIAFGVVLLVVALNLWIIFFVEHRRFKDIKQYVPSFLTTCLISLGAACTQGSHLVPGSVGGRVAFISLSLIAFIMYNYYTSIVVSSLLSSPAKSSIKSMGQLADSSLDVGIEPAPYTFSYLNVSPRPEIRRFVERKIKAKKNPDKVWMSKLDGIQRVREEPGFVFVFEASSAYALVEKYYEPYELCDLNEIMLRPEKTIYQIFHKNSSYKEIIREKILRFHETGVYSKHVRYWLKSVPPCIGNNIIIDVGMEYTAPLFVGLVCSYLVVLVLLAIEIAHKKIKEKRKRFHILHFYKGM